MTWVVYVSRRAGWADSQRVYWSRGEFDEALSYFGAQDPSKAYRFQTLAAAEVVASKYSAHVAPLAESQ